MHPRLAEARKVEAMEAIPVRLDRLEQKIDRILDLLTAPAPAGVTKPPTAFNQPPAKGR